MSTFTGVAESFQDPLPRPLPSPRVRPPSWLPTPPSRSRWRWDQTPELPVGPAGRRSWQLKPAQRHRPVSGMPASGLRPCSTRSLQQRCSAQQQPTKTPRSPSEEPENQAQRPPSRLLRIASEDDPSQGVMWITSGCRNPWEKLRNLERRIGFHQVRPALRPSPDGFDAATDLGVLTPAHLISPPRPTAEHRDAPRTTTLPLADTPRRALT